MLKRLQIETLSFSTLRIVSSASFLCEKFGTKEGVLERQTNEPTDFIIWVCCFSVMCEIKKESTLRQIPRFVFALKQRLVDSVDSLNESADLAIS